MAHQKSFLQLGVCVIIFSILVSSCGPANPAAGAPQLSPGEGSGSGGDVISTAIAATQTSSAILTGVPSETPVSAPSETSTPSPTETLIASNTDVAPTLAQTGCTNPYMPVVVGATWRYNVTGELTDSYTHSIISADDSSFSEQDVFGTGITRHAQWKCDNGNLIALDPTNGGTAVLNSINSGLNFQTTVLEGVTIPATINAGDTWTQFTRLEGSESVAGTTYPARNEITSNCTAVGNESVTVPAGTFTAMRVDCAVNMNFTVNINGSAMSNSLTLSNSTWYAVNIGMVKSTSGGGLVGVIELTSYNIP